MENKSQFIEVMKARTKKLAVEVIAFMESLNRCKASAVITYQAVKSVTSTAANYRTACLARSKKEFYAKICIVAEEVDETVFWLELIQDSNLTTDLPKLLELLNESTQISKIINKAKGSSYKFIND